MKKILYLIAVSIGLLASCTKEEIVETTPYEKIQPGDPKYSYFKVLNLAGGTPSVNYYLDGTKSSGVYSTTGVESGYAYNGVFPDLGYAVASPGTHTVAARINSSATPVADRGLEVFSAPFDFVAGKYFSIVTTGVYNATTKKISSSVILQDVRPALDTTKIFVRFANLLTDAPNLDLNQTLNGVTTKVATNIAFGKASEFTAMVNPAKANLYNITNSATGAVLYNLTTAITLTKGRAITLYLRGVNGNITYPPTLTFYTTFY